jgi:hypothetical protein
VEGDLLALTVGGLTLLLFAAVAAAAAACLEVRKLTH